MNNWISIEDELPEDDKLKVVKYKDSRSNKHIGVALSRYYIPSNQKNKKYWCFEFGSGQPTKVSHWASLPEDKS